MCMKKSIFVIVSIVIVGAVIVGFVRKQSHIVGDTKQSVTTKIAKESVFTHEDFFGALVKNSDEAVIAAQIGGNIDKIFVQEGDFVQKGQKLAHINAPEIAAQYENANIGVQIAQEQEKNARRKWDDYKPEEREQIKLSTDSARASRAETSAALSKSYIIAPFDGIVSKKFIESGTTVRVGEKIVYIVGNTNHEEAIFDVPTSVGDSVSVGDRVQIMNDMSVSDATVIAVSPVSDSASRKMTIRVAIDDGIQFVLGSFVDVIIQDNVSKYGISVPKESIVNQYNDTFVFVVVNDIAYIKNVNVVGKNSYGIIVDGISDGDMVVVSGAHSLGDGDMVDVVESKNQ